MIFLYFYFNILVLCYSLNNYSQSCDFLDYTAIFDTYYETCYGVILSLLTIKYFPFYFLHKFFIEFLLIFFNNSFFYLSLIDTCFGVEQY